MRVKLWYSGFADTCATGKLESTELDSINSWMSPPTRCPVIGVGKRLTRVHGAD